MRTSLQRFVVVAAIAGFVANSGCSGEGYPVTPATGGASSATGGITPTGGVLSGGAPSSSGGSALGSGGASSGFASSSGGINAFSGGQVNGGQVSGGSVAFTGGVAATGGSSGGFTLSGGVAGSGASTATSGGFSSSGGASGGTPTGGGAGALASGGKGSGGLMATGGAPTISFSQVEVIVGNVCSGCHVNRRPIFTTTGTTLYNTLTSTTVKQCSNHKLVVSGSAATSALIELVTDKCNGFRMPTSCSNAMCLAADELATLQSWIAAGAKGP